MTFYWWSHWFWITLLCNLIIPLIVVVHTYPSQDSTLEYNQNGNVNPQKLVTKLYQTSTTLGWTTEIPKSERSTTVGKLKLQSITNDDEAEIPIKEETPIILNDKGDEEYYYNDDEDEPEVDEKKKINIDQVESELEKEDQESSATNRENKYIDVKRSAEVFNRTTSDPKSDLKLIDASTTMTIVEKNNYTNFTDKLSSTNSSAIMSLNSPTNITTPATTTNNNNSNSDLVTTTTTATSAKSNVTTQLPPGHPPSTPKIVNSQQSSHLEWLNTVAAQLPPARVTTDVTQDYPEDQHKIPFTLENVNKPEDLRREESEHRSRKSKGLSAEYKVNLYPNLDSRNHLTRSAATTVNEYDSEESNISSEALSVQRAYFMDVGAISAICFTVFGICCTVGTVGMVLYRRRFLNKPQALSEPDSSVYIDDSTMRVSDNSDEMYSLDNDSFLNSLEAMTIQNYWTDTVKHTKL